MQSNFFYDDTIPLWNPKFGDTSLCVGDVGFFNDRGDFEVQFNIFLSSAENDELGFDSPDGFQEYSSVKFCHEVSNTEFVSPDNHKTYTGNFESLGLLGR